MTLPQDISQDTASLIKDKLYEGKAKILYHTSKQDALCVYFKDDATAFNNQKKGQVIGKGIVNNYMTEFFMLALEDIGIPTHFIKRLDERTQLVKAVQIAPVEVIVRNIAAGSMAKRLGIEEGLKLPHSLVEFCYKSDELGDPLISEDHVMLMGWASKEELDQMRCMALRINDFMGGLFRAIGLRLVDYKLEFGRLNTDNGQVLILADELSPDNMRLWDLKTGEKMDKDRFRRDLGGTEEAYQEVAKRLGLKIG